MKIFLIAAAALTLVACAPQPTPQETEAEVTKKLGLNGGECLQCAQDALEGACQDELDACAADLAECLNGGTAIEGIALCIVAECGATCVDDGAGGSPATDPIDDGAGAGGSGTTGSGDPGTGGLGGGGNGGGGGDTCPPDDGGCGGCDDDDSCDIDAVCDDLLACGEDCWLNTSDDDEFLDCLINVCGATEDLADECDLD